MQPKNKRVLFDGHDQQRIKTLSVDFGGKDFFCGFHSVSHTPKAPLLLERKDHRVDGLQSISRPVEASGLKLPVADELIE
jgi:hypothetical protein